MANVVQNTPIESTASEIQRRLQERLARSFAIVESPSNLEKAYHTGNGGR
jgi:hypothetical protein